MIKYDDLLKNYEKMKDEYDTYQSFSESSLQMLKEKNSTLEKKLDALYSIIEISNYINTNVRNKDFISMVNDMVIGILGVIYSTIYVKENGVYTCKASNMPQGDKSHCEKDFIRLIRSSEPFIINSKLPVFASNSEKIDIHSVIGLPISVRSEIIGYIVVEHSLCNFFNHDHIKFIASITNQIGIAIENNILYNKVKESSIRDPLLQIYNRRYFFNELENRVKENPRQCFSIVMIDLDDFKKINDRYGHQFGDEVLIQTVKLIEKSIDSEDIIARYGGEEIVLFINQAQNKQNSLEKVESIRKRVGENVIRFGTIETSITASFGVSFYPDHSLNLDELVDAADKHLYKAKQTGKNRVISA